MSWETILIQFVLPLVTLAGGWFANAYRNKQTKEKDILDNVQQIIDIQKEYIGKQQAELNEIKTDCEKYRSRLELKRLSIHKALTCKFAHSEYGCPVVAQEEKNEQLLNECMNCEHYKDALAQQEETN